ncbi:hypothetical protein WBP07_00295 [Novosphingobium sp. BL-8A]|uniref:hypothetical protein n=1 Tax=Novosphingobium sp. BL-8A TaxID=3127639 RepID=UPI0037584A46
MRQTLFLAACTAVVSTSAAQAQEAGATPVPAAVGALAGCWQGSGEVMGKAVSIALAAKPVALGAMFTIDADSIAQADPTDRYGAHLTLGGTKDGGIAGYWADSFGGDYTATGHGEVRPSGFDVMYDYGDNAFINRWRIEGAQSANERLNWQIVARSKTSGTEKPFAHYTLSRTACPQ